MICLIEWLFKDFFGTWIFIHNIIENIIVPSSPLLPLLEIIYNWSLILINFPFLPIYLGINYELCLALSFLSGINFLGWYRFKMAATQITGAIRGSFVIAYVWDSLFFDRKIFGGQSSIYTNAYSLEKLVLILIQRGLIQFLSFMTGSAHWRLLLNKKSQACSRTAVPLVFMNLISHHNFIVKSSDS